MIDKQKLINMATPDTNISERKSTDPKLWLTLKNLGDVVKSIINTVLPPLPVQAWEYRITLAGNPAVANDVLASHYHVLMPVDPLLYWDFTSINLDSCYITAKIAPGATPLSVDFKVAQKKGTGTFKTIFQSSFNSKLPVGFKSAHNVKFAINSLFQDDILRVDVLATDGSVSGIEVVLTGNYVLEAKST